ncbi:phosphopantetheine-binding protein [Waltera sp.]|jgi:acyl carrier protein|uniref:phosphopantetheine-binding protein n=1 Tax=Lachnospiraceae TaxID=186803 RepID=UPI003A42AE02
MDKAIKEIIKKYTQYQDAITEDTLLSVLEISSLSFVSLIVDLEDYYSVELGDDELDFSVYDTIGELLIAFSDN